MKTTKFSQLTKAEKRVAVAKDVIKQLRQNRVKITRGRFVILPSFTTQSQRTREMGFDGQELRAILPKIKPCHVCAIGALFISTVLKDNKFKITTEFEGSAKEIGYNAIFSRLVKLFSPLQIALIESAFEVGKGHYSYALYTSSAALPKAADFGKQFKSLTERAIAIMKNIIANNGTFIPKAESDQGRDSMDPRGRTCRTT